MRKLLILILLSMSILASCINDNNEDLEKHDEIILYDLPPMILWNDQIYNIMETNDYTEDDFDEKIGVITSIVNGTETPSEHGQANVFIKDLAIYSIRDLHIDNGFLIKFNNHIFITKPVE